MKQSLCIIFMLLTSVMYSHDGTIKGKVLDRQSELSLIGATVELPKGGLTYTNEVAINISFNENEHKSKKRLR